MRHRGDLMTYPVRFKRLPLVALLFLALPFAASAQVAGRHRAVAHPGNTAGDVNVTGTVSDAENSPLAGAIVSFGDRTSNVTGSNGKYSISLPSGSTINLSVDQFAYAKQTKTITVSAGAIVNFALTAKSLTTIKLKNGDTKRVVSDTGQFAFLIPFSGYIRSDQANLCKPDGSGFTPNRSEIVKITGPITAVNFAPCCEKAPVVTANFQMKTGETIQAYFVDSCFGNDVVFLGRDPNGGAFTYISFPDIQEIDFP
jgi:hypothetical protein